MDSLSGKEKQVIPKKGPRIPDSHYRFNTSIRNKEVTVGRNKNEIHNTKLKQRKCLRQANKEIFSTLATSH